MMSSRSSRGSSDRERVAEAALVRALGQRVRALDRHRALSIVGYETGGASVSTPFDVSMSIAPAESTTDRLVRCRPAGYSPGLCRVVHAEFVFQRSGGVMQPEIDAGPQLAIPDPRIPGQLCLPPGRLLP